MVFVRSHGSIKEMERTFGISYPTVKNRLNRISAQLELVETDPVPGQSEILAQLMPQRQQTRLSLARLDLRPFQPGWLRLASASPAFLTAPLRGG